MPATTIDVPAAPGVAFSSSYTTHPGMWYVTSGWPSRHALQTHLIRHGESVVVAVVLSQPMTAGDASYWIVTTRLALTSESVGRAVVEAEPDLDWVPFQEPLGPAVSADELIAAYDKRPSAVSEP